MARRLRTVAAGSLALALALTACSPAPAATPAATTPTPATPSPSVSPAVDPTALMDGLRAFAEDEARTYHLDIEGRLSVRPVDGHIDGAIDASGDDAEMSMSLDFNLFTLRMDLVVVDDTAWVRIDHGAWTSVERTELEEDFDPMAELLAAEDVRYRGTVRRAGATVHHLQLANVDVLDPRSLSAEVEDIHVRAQTFDVYVDGVGTPVEARYQLDGTATLASGRTVPMFMDITYRFSEIGEPHEVEPPV
ncbi:MAG TPA: hypothetical protein VFK54_10750 [Candidatus Limnocylindrales bacterium]|nr:hypothetical protein [Candidatus Limnocylindrales bacterium]